MEDGLGAPIKWDTKSWEGVLILVLVEDGLGAGALAPQKLPKSGLNPCFSGGWSRSCNPHLIRANVLFCLNPCFSGGWSRSGRGNTNKPATDES